MDKPVLPLNKYLFTLDTDKPTDEKYTIYARNITSAIQKLHNNEGIDEVEISNIEIIHK
jgi:hypothetical protein